MLVSRTTVLFTAAFAASILAACSGGGQTDASAATSGGGGSGASTAATGSGSTTATTGSTTAATSSGSTTATSGSTTATSGSGGSAGTGGAAGTGGSAGTGGGAGTGGAVVAMTDPPQVVDPAPAGPVLTAPKVQLIAYTEDPFATDVEKMLVELTQTQTWAEQTSEYGVGPLTLLPTITIAGTPPATLDDNSGNVTPFEKTLASNLSGANPAWGAADPNTIYLFLLPQGTADQLGRPLLRPLPRLLRLPLGGARRIHRRGLRRRLQLPQLRRRRRSRRSRTSPPP